MQLAPTFTVHNAGGRSRVTNVYGDHTTNTTINCGGCCCVARDADGGEIRRRCATRAQDAEEEDHEALSSTRRRTRAPESESQQGRADSPEDTRKPSVSPLLHFSVRRGFSDVQRQTAAAAAVSIQFNLALGGPSYESQIVISCGVVAVSTGALFFF